MSTTIVDIDRIEQIELRQQMHYWRTQHARATERAAAWKQKAQQLELILRQRDATIAEQNQKSEALKARIAWLAQQVFGRKTKATSASRSDTGNEDQDIAESSQDGLNEFSEDSSEDPKRKRGQQNGAKGHGRKRRLGLPSVAVPHELPEAKRCCPKCGKPFRVFPGTEDSEQIEWDVILRRRIHKWVRYVPTCDCHVVPPASSCRRQERGHHALQSSSPRVCSPSLSGFGC